MLNDDIIYCLMLAWGTLMERASPQLLLRQIWGFFFQIRVAGLSCDFKMIERIFTMLFLYFCDYLIYICAFIIKLFKDFPIHSIIYLYKTTRRWWSWFFYFNFKSNEIYLRVFSFLILIFCILNHAYLQPHKNKKSDTCLL